MAYNYFTLLQARSVYDSPVGQIHLAATAQALAGTWLPTQTDIDFEQLALQVPLQPNHPILQQAHQALDAYFAGQVLVPPPVTFLIGTPFQQQVWHALLQIPHGESTTYGAIAQQLGKPQASRAIGMAVGRNPISIFVPCHRVLGANRKITGYSGGLDNKRTLLQLEAIPYTN